ncbi:hypothetical protein ACMFMG_002331 [Clarireedia jacksonii]
MPTINTFTNISQPSSSFNGTGFGLQTNGASLFNDGAHLDVNSVIDQALFVPFENYDMLSPNEPALPRFSNGQGYQDQLMLSQSTISLNDNFQQADTTPGMINLPAAANAPTDPVAAIQRPPAAAQPALYQRVPCTLCVRTFGRRSDLTRHMTSVHNVGLQVLHLCTVAGCPKSVGAGFSRKDKVAEHLRRVHGL